MDADTPLPPALIAHCFGKCGDKCEYCAADEEDVKIESLYRDFGEPVG